jgi:ABC-type transporter Mla MlaB component
MLKVDLRSFSDTKIEYSLTGSLTAEDLPGLKHIIDCYAGKKMDLTLHLGGLSHIDETCLAFLVEGEGRSVHLSGVSALLIEKFRLHREEAPEEG